MDAEAGPARTVDWEKAEERGICIDAPLAVTTEVRLALACWNRRLPGGPAPALDAREVGGAEAGVPSGNGFEVLGLAAEGTALAKPRTEPATFPLPALDTAEGASTSYCHSEVSAFFFTTSSKRARPAASSAATSLGTSECGI